MPKISSITETDNHGDGRGGLVYSRPAHRLTNWMDCVSGVDRGIKTVEPIVASGKTKRIPHWESFSERSTIIAEYYHDEDGADCCYMWN